MNKRNLIVSLMMITGLFAQSVVGIVNDADTIGRMLAARGHKLTYGGGRTGLMGAVSGGALVAGGHVHGIIPHFLESLEVGNQQVQKLDVVENMHERKAKMYEEADGFIVLPGGLGTMDEWMEVMTWNQLGLLKSPVFVMNTDGYWQRLLEMIDHANKTGFVHSKGIFEMYVAATPDELIDLVDGKKQAAG